MRLPVVLLLVCTCATPLAAQENAGLRGRVADADGRGVAVATVVVLGAAAVVLTDSAGEFRVRGIPPGEHVVEVSALGLKTVRIVHVFLAGETGELAVVLKPDPLLVDTLTADAEVWRLSSQMQGFHDRRLRGGGYFFTQADVRRMQAYQFTDVLRRVPGMYLQAVEGPYGNGYVVQLRRATGASGGRPCPVLFFINGTPFPVTPDVGIDTFVRPEDISGVEVYSGAARLPPQFSSTPNNSRCGVVAIWISADRRADRDER